MGPYTALLTSLYVLLLVDACINASADSIGAAMTKPTAILVLIAQLLVRLCCFFTTVGMLAASRSWRDEFLLQYCGLFAVSLAGLIIGLFLRVYRVTLAAYPSRLLGRR